ncbi:unnamed protein product [Effrenium voratum]|uniref:Transposase n=1 Tax=Effrenium voratum TaxID=2562239 RepID=A0AA36JB32_9DINO|nr:unnamed protein product [Effrenium voratum]CAJ1456258.1 unnamed protein product [Effrenium voratum]
MEIPHASFQGEAVLMRLLDPGVRVRARQQLPQAWARETMWRRAGEAAADVKERLAAQLLSWPLEKMIEANWSWYEPMMFERRREQLLASGNRLDILAIDGNCKLHRRTCGMPFAEVVPSPHVGKLLLRGCSQRPHGADTLCCVHAADRDLPGRPCHGEIGSHRLKRALHAEGDVCHLEVRLAGFGSWQPACTVGQEMLARYFANLADANIRRRRQKRVESRAKKWIGMRPRRRTFLAPWSSARARQESSCQTHKETEQHVTAAARTAGFLLAVSEGGLVADCNEVIAAESLSQRYHFLAKVASRLNSLQIVVHDDACHLRLFCAQHRLASDIAGRLSNMSFIVDRFHATGHKGVFCRNHCLPTSQNNELLLGNFPTDIAESVNALYSPLGHTIHHMNKHFAQLVVQECTDVHNLARLQSIRDKQRASAKKRRLSQA